MTVNVIYFARLRESLGKSSERIALPSDVKNLADLRELLRGRGGAWATELGEGTSTRAAVNQDMAKSDTAINDGDEIAFFPPVTGG